MVYVITVYDVEADRTGKARRLLRQYLNHVQNSVFEGELTKGELDDIKHELDELINPTESAMIFSVTTEKYVDRTVYGEDPMEDSQFI